MDAREEAEYLGAVRQVVLDELGAPLTTSFTAADQCAIEVAVLKAVTRAHDLGIASGASQATTHATELGLELTFDPVVGDSAELPDEWEERFGGEEA